MIPDAVVDAFGILIVVVPTELTIFGFNPVVPTFIICEGFEFPFIFFIIPEAVNIPETVRLFKNVLFPEKDCVPVVIIPDAVDDALGILTFVVPEVEIIVGEFPEEPIIIN